MKERGMIFNAEMVRAILDGRKTQTRRIMKLQPEILGSGLRYITESHEQNEVGKYFWCISDALGMHARSAIFTCPFGAVGDHIWVRETFSAVPDYDEPAGCSALLYAADGNGPYRKWTPSIHMPRWASRLTLEITGIRVERLNSITESDAEAEGVTDTGFGDLLVDGYRYLWKSIYGEESWAANPWVWVIEFKRVEGGAA
ncbi:hypothetical protein GA093_15755 [Salmonella enterica]|nr:hypothetical protein [Salmonella enterica]EDS1675305.1 hypothetical protein [Salmonella enterica subsp. enterica serovar Arechavaleta]EBL6910374.1 hypothetical protein [Salmonella enterica]ECD8943099.1 hypothetical protein [Salmonella enterica]ECJ9234323.1 hypothetical protein [Salmonella enterica]